MKSVIDFLIDDYERELDDFKEWGMNYDDLEYARKNIRDYVDALQARAEKAEAMVEGVPYVSFSNAEIAAMTPEHPLYKLVRGDRKCKDE